MIRKKNLTKKKNKGPSTFHTSLVLNLTNRYPFSLIIISVLFLKANVMLVAMSSASPAVGAENIFQNQDQGKGN